MLLQHLKSLSGDKREHGKEPCFTIFSHLVLVKKSNKYMSTFFLKSPVSKTEKYKPYKKCEHWSRSNKNFLFIIIRKFWCTHRVGIFPVRVPCEKQEVDYGPPNRYAFGRGGDSSCCFWRCWQWWWWRRRFVLMQVPFQRSRETPTKSRSRPASDHYTTRVHPKPH